MKLTKFGHSCVRLSDGDRRLMIDPGIFSDLDAALKGVDAVLITHEHPDHVDIDRLREAAVANPSLEIWAPPSVAAAVPEATVNVVVAGAPFMAAGFHIDTYGGQHALIHPTVPVIPNIGYVVDQLVYHPGDCLVVPSAPVQVLLAPVHAPWSKTSEVADFVVGVRAPQVFGVHDGLLNARGLTFTEGHIARIGGMHGSEYRHLSEGESLTV